MSRSSRSGRAADRCSRSAVTVNKNIHSYSFNSSLIYYSITVFHITVSSFFIFTVNGAQGDSRRHNLSSKRSGTVYTVVVIRTNKFLLIEDQIMKSEMSYVIGRGDNVLLFSVALTITST